LIKSKGKISKFLRHLPAVRKKVYNLVFLNTFTYRTEILLMVAQTSKESACNMGHPSLIPGSGRSPGEGNGYPFQYFCLENSMNRGA